MRPCSTFTRSVAKYSASLPVLPSRAGGASPGTPDDLFPKTCRLPSKPTTVTARLTSGTRAAAAATFSEYPVPVMGENSVNICMSEGLVLAR